MISDYYRDRTHPARPPFYPETPPFYPETPLPGPVHPFTPQPQPYLPPVADWDNETKKLMREVLERLDKIDKRLGDVECHDESKDEFMKQVGLR